MKHRHIQPDPQTLAEARSQIRRLRRELKAADEQIDMLQKAAGLTVIDGYEPDPRIERMYGWLHTALSPLTSLPYADPNLCNQVHDTARAILVQLVLEGKYGIRAPLEVRTADVTQFVARQEKSLRREYPPCVICGEARITHECHVLPAADGGPYHHENLVILCPLHHHLFDHHRLTEAEWQVLEEQLGTLMESAHLYALQVRLVALQRWWGRGAPA
jgi:hypothetical protein